MLYHYAQIDETTGNVVCDSRLSGKLDLPNMILIPEGMPVLGKRYNFETKTFEEIPQPTPSPDDPEPIPIEPTETLEDTVDMLVAETLEQSATIEQMQETIDSMQSDIDTLVINSLEPEGE